MTPEWLSKALCTLQVAKEQCWHREQSWTRSNCLCVLQEAEEPQALRSIGIDPAAFIAEVHLDGRHAEAVACCYLYGNSGGKCFEAKQHANVESIMHMPDCSCDLCFCLSQHRFCIVLGQAKHQSPCENRLAQSSSPRVWLALCCVGVHTHPPPPPPPLPPSGFVVLQQRPHCFLHRCGMVLGSNGRARSRLTCHHCLL